MTKRIDPGTSRRGQKTLRPIEDRFWEKVIKNDDGCWGWTGKPDRQGYGELTAYRRSDQKHWRVRAPRLSWEIHNGPIPEGLWVLHHCDNPPCVRPDHLWLGTVQDNNADRDAKGRNKGGRKRRSDAP